MEANTAPSPPRSEDTKAVFKQFFSSLYAQYIADGTAPSQAAARALLEAQQKVRELTTGNAPSPPFPTTPTPTHASNGSTSMELEAGPDSEGQKGQEDNSNSGGEDGSNSSDHHSKMDEETEADTPALVPIAAAAAAAAVPATAKKLPPLPHQLPPPARSTEPPLDVHRTLSLLKECEAAGTYTALIRAAGSFFRCVCVCVCVSPSLPSLLLPTPSH